MIPDPIPEPVALIQLDSGEVYVVREYEREPQVLHFRGRRRKGCGVHGAMDFVYGDEEVSYSVPWSRVRKARWFDSDAVRGAR